MATKHNLLAGGVIAVLSAGTLLTLGQKTRRKAQADENRSSDTPTVRFEQIPQPGAPAELIGRTGYALYR